ncbi:MAG: carboxylating nicotinate-nucleotide diphosphorylase [Cyclobacteriaceae bacterium]|nr:carboxylating nicotinate-nucleotide diphosphorylase [Cyclobacteriaceae bacterium]
MRPNYITDPFLKQFIDSALSEDVGSGDHSSLASVSDKTLSHAKLIIKDNGVLAGVELAVEIFAQFDPTLRIEKSVNDGDTVKKGEIAFLVKGKARSILTTERLVLNCMQRMSGIATLTNRLVKLVEGTGVKLLDTRKTTPNFRMLEKWAVLIGGGFNHRLGLYDMIMLKDNHIEMAGGIEKAIIRTKEYLRANKLDLKIEVETRNLKEVEQVVRIGGVDVIMLDNMELSEMKEAVSLISGNFTTEASGGITEQTIRDVALCGVDFISVGALTHSVKSLDLSLKQF